MLRRNFLGALLAPLVPIQTGVEVKSPLGEFMDQQAELRRQAKKNLLRKNKLRNNVITGARVNTAYFPLCLSGACIAKHLET